jgi:pimeloyl-ACP methyl ester carboxylesterase
MFWREVGRGPTVVFLHGSWSDSSQWVPLMQTLGDRCHCLAPDLIGFGESSRLRRNPYSIALEVNSLTEWLTALRSQSVLIVADSIGAWVASRYALHHPHQVQGLIILNPEGVTPPGLRGRWRGFPWLAHRWSLRFGLLQLVKPLLAVLGKRPWLRRVQARRQQLRHSPAACRLLFQGRHQERATELLDGVLPGLVPPVWVLQPQGSDAIAQALTQTYASLVGQGTPKPLAATPPGQPAESPELARLIQAFLDAHPTPARPKRYS